MTARASKDLYGPAIEQLTQTLSMPGVDVQLFLAIFTFFFTYPLALLICRLLQHKRDINGKLGFFAFRAAPELAWPLSMIFCMIIARGISGIILPESPDILSGFILLSLLFLFVRLLLMASQRHPMAYFISLVLFVMIVLDQTGFLLPLQDSLNNAAFELGTFRFSLLGLLKGLFALVVLFWGAGVISNLGERGIRKLGISFGARELSIKLLNIALYFVAFLLTLNELGVNLAALTIFGGAVGVGLGFGLQKIASNFVSGIVLLFEKTMKEGDLVEVSGEKGWVRRLGIRHTLVEAGDGRVILIPNEEFITSKVSNWTYNAYTARGEILLILPHETEIRQVFKILLETARSYPHCMTDPGPTCNLKDFTDKGIVFQLIFWIPDIHTGIAQARTEIMTRIAKRFKDEQIAFVTAAQAG